MTFNSYITLLCILVFALFTGLFTVMIVSTVKQHIRLVRAGLEDEQIIKEYNMTKKKSGTLYKIVSALFCILISAFLAFSIYVGFAGDKKVKGVPVLKVVSSASMSSKYEENEYLFKNNLDNQFDTFDLLILHELPKEEDLKLYDIVVYEIEGLMVVHRIVGIEEPNEKHPDERYFLMQGDAVGSPDRFPVKYEQMRSIYRGQRVRFVGSFIYFMKSPAGILCYLLILVAAIAMPITEKKLKKEYEKRLADIKALDSLLAEDSRPQPPLFDDKKYYYD